ncbi:hypothetical protein [Kineosporia babensis]|uniref:Uncharacterized protein n=1 Tax=Kineosporia babensis TaxID=499548 RepID=A0A9X1NJI3_9ACTN|nr:hypothetical protein [Kineosporia babensis]MCD5316157.1 hypothetical protein [Kineosporia babensis]
MSIHLDTGALVTAVPVAEPDASITVLPPRERGLHECGAHDFEREVAAHLERLLRQPVTRLVHRENPWYRRVCPAATFTDITIGGHHVAITAWTSYEGRRYDPTQYALTLDEQSLAFCRLPVDDLAGQLARAVWLHHLDLPAHEHPPATGEDETPPSTPIEEEPSVHADQPLLDTVIALIRQFVPDTTRITLTTGDEPGQGFHLTDIQTRSHRSIATSEPSLIGRLDDDLWTYLNDLRWDAAVGEDDYGTAHLDLNDDLVTARTVWSCMTCGFDSALIREERDHAHDAFDSAHPAAWHAEHIPTESAHAEHHDHR